MSSETRPPTGLSAYLNDHLAGSAAALQLVRRRRDREGDSGLGRTLARLADEIEEDRATLERVMEELGIGRNPAKRAGAMGAELLLRVKQTLTSVGVGSSKAAVLEDLELLSLGIEGKALLWRALGTLADADSLAVDFAALQARAREQRAVLDPFLREAAERAFED